MEKKENFKMFYALSIAMQLGFFIITPIVGFLLLGKWIDKIHQTQPLFLIIGVIIGFFVTFYEVYNILKPLINKKNN